MFAFSVFRQLAPRQLKSFTSAWIVLITAFLSWFLYHNRFSKSDLHAYRLSNLDRFTTAGQFRWWSFMIKVVWTLLCLNTFPIILPLSQRQHFWRASLEPLSLVRIHDLRRFYHLLLCFVSVLKHLQERPSLLSHFTQRILVGRNSIIICNQAIFSFKCSRCALKLSLMKMTLNPVQQIYLFW